MPRDIPTFDEALAMIRRIDEQYRPVWESRPLKEQVALALYFLPHHSAKPTLAPSRPRMIKWYSPFAHQHSFPSGHRYCINVYVGCSHGCAYCYVKGYGNAAPACKQNFERLLAQDLADLDRFDVPPAPVHLSNSTDCFQPLELKAGHTRHALEQILEFRHRFTTVTLLTKNPTIAAQPEYVELLRQLCQLPAGHPKAEEFAREGRPAFCVEVSLAFWREEARRFYDPAAPTVEQRMAGVRALRAAGVPVVLRIDPLFPRSPFADGSRRTLQDFGLPEAQTLDDLENLVGFAKEMQARHVVHSPCKIVKPRGCKLDGPMLRLREAYTHIAAPAPLVWRGGSWRLPPNIADAKVTGPFLEICQRHGVKTSYCMRNLIETP